MTDPTRLTTEALQREVDAIRREALGGRELMEARIAGMKEVVDLQFNLITEWRLEQKEDTRTAVNAALAAQKEAITKQEISTSRQIDQLSAAFATAIEELRRVTDELKERVGKIESVKVGMTEARAALYAFGGFIAALAVIGGFVAALWPR